MKAIQERIREAIRSFEKLGEKVDTMLIPDHIFDDLATELKVDAATCVLIPLDGVAIGRSNSDIKVEVHYA